MGSVGRSEWVGVFLFGAFARVSKALNTFILRGYRIWLWGRRSPSVVCLNAELDQCKYRLLAQSTASGF
jgi:hypothetical protein